MKGFGDDDDGFVTVILLIFMFELARHIKPQAQKKKRAKSRTGGANSSSAVQLAKDENGEKAREVNTIGLGVMGLFCFITSNMPSFSVLVLHVMM